MELRCGLNLERRKEIEADGELLAGFASSLSSDSLTVGVPSTSKINPEGRIEVRVTPQPVCPKCGAKALTVFGYPESEQMPLENSVVASMNEEEFKGTWLLQFPLSVRTRSILNKLGIHIVRGLLQLSEEEINSRFPNSQGSIDELNEILSLKGLRMSQSTTRIER